VLLFPIGLVAMHSMASTYQYRVGMSWVCLLAGMGPVVIARIIYYDLAIKALL